MRLDIGQPSRFLPPCKRNSNRGPVVRQPIAIKIDKAYTLCRSLVEVTGFEHATSWSRTRRATKLRYTSSITSHIITTRRGNGKRFSKYLSNRIPTRIRGSVRGDMRRDKTRRARGDQKCKRRLSSPTYDLRTNIIIANTSTSPRAVQTYQPQPQLLSHRYEIPMHSADNTHRRVSAIS